MSASSDPLALQFGGFTRVKWSRADMLSVCSSIFSLALGLIIGLEVWGSFSSSHRWLDGCFDDGMSKGWLVKKRAQSHIQTWAPGGYTKHDVTRERSKYESLIHLFIIGGMYVWVTPGKKAVDVKTCSFPSALSLARCCPASICPHSL